MSDDIKYLDIAEFHRLGFVQEINRRLLHPCGLAMSVEMDAHGNATGFGGIWDYREDAEGIYFEQVDLAGKAASVDALIAAHADARQADLGYVIQPVGASLGVPEAPKEEKLQADIRHEAPTEDRSLLTNAVAEVGKNPAIKGDS